MPTMYIKAESAKCEVTDFKDVTIVVDIKQSINYLSFKIKNTGEQEINVVKIVLPFCSDDISEIKSNTRECISLPVYDIHNNIGKKYVELSYKMEESLKKNESCPVEVGFKITLPKAEKELILDFYNLSPIEKQLHCKPNSPFIHTETMGLYVILPKLCSPKKSLQVL